MLWCSSNGFCECSVSKCLFIYFFGSFSISSFSFFLMYDANVIIFPLITTFVVFQRLHDDIPGITLYSRKDVLFFFQSILWSFDFWVECYWSAIWGLCVVCYQLLVLCLLGHGRRWRWCWWLVLWFCGEWSYLLERDQYGSRIYDVVSGKYIIWSVGLGCASHHQVHSWICIAWVWVLIGRVYTLWVKRICPNEG